MSRIYIHSHLLNITNIRSHLLSIMSMHSLRLKFSVPSLTASKRRSATALQDQDADSDSPLHCKKKPRDLLLGRSALFWPWICPWGCWFLGITIIFHGKLRTKHEGDRTVSFSLLKFWTTNWKVVSERASSGNNEKILKCTRMID